MPINSIAAIDVPNLTSAQQKVLMNGTPVIARACYDQFFADFNKMNGKIPSDGRIVYTAAINLDEFNSWLKSESGKQYSKKHKKPNSTTP